MNRTPDPDKGLEDVSPNSSKTGVAIILVMMAFLFWGSYVWNWWGSSMEKKGQLGDAFGPLTSIFSGLTFLYFVYNIELQRRQLIYQKKDFNLQLEELKETREELKKQSQAQQKSEEALRMQIKKQTLSTLLSSYTSRFNTLVNNAKTPHVHLLFIEEGDLINELFKLKVRIAAIEELLEEELNITTDEQHTTD